MCYLVVKQFDKIGCLVLRTKPGKHLTQLKKQLESEIKSDKLQLVTISRPSAYGEYEPYHFVDTEQELKEKSKQMFS